MKRILLSFSLLAATLSGQAQEVQTPFHTEDLKALETFVKSYPDHELLVNYWEDMMYYENVGTYGKFGVKWEELEGENRIVKFVVNLQAEDNLTFEDINLNGLKALKEVVLKTAGVKTLDVSAIETLTTIELVNNDLRSMEIPTTLTTLRLDGNPNYTNGDFSKLTNLNNLMLYNMPIEDVKIGATGLKYITMFDLPIKKVNLEIAKSTLQDININRCPMEGVIFDGYDNLISLKVENAGLTNIPLANLAKPLALALSGNQIENMDLTAFPLVKSLAALNCGIKTVSFSPESEALGNMNLNDNQIERIDVSGWNFQASTMGMLRLNNNPLVEFTSHPMLKQIYLNNCMLTSLDVTVNGTATMIDAIGNQLVFTSVKLPKYNRNFKLGPQDSIAVAKTEGDIKYLNPGDVVDLSAYVSPEDGETVYEWFEETLKDGKLIFLATNKIAASDQTGVFIMPDDAAGKYYCKIKTTSPFLKDMFLPTESFILNSTTGLNQTKSGLKLYPNPVVDNLFISGCENKTVEVYNAAGMLIYHTNATQNEIQVNTANWAKGIYVVKVGTETYKMNKK